MTDIPPDAKTLKITLQCPNCKTKYPSPIFLTPYAAFMSVFMSGNKSGCPACEQMHDCNRENFVAQFEGGGFVGNQALL